MSNRKYPEVKGYWVYSIYVPSIAKYYVGISKSKECCQRWQKSRYIGIVLEQYLDEWDSMEKTVIQDNLTKEEALKKEDELIQALRLKDLCINSNRSGLIRVTDKNAYNREYYKNNSEYRKRRKEYIKQWQKDNKEKEKERKKQYYEDNKEKISKQRRQRRLKKKLEKQQQTVVP